jgi:hypothetical protein
VKRLLVSVEGFDERAYLSMALDATEPGLGIEHRRSDPA